MGRLLNMRPEGLDERFSPYIGVFINLAILQYELGRMANCILYGFSAWVNKVDDRLARAHLSFAKSECSDLLLQIQLLAERMGWDIEELGKMGIDRYKDRMKEIKEKKV